MAVIKGSSQDWFDTEIMEKKFKKSRLHVDKDNYKEARNEVQKLISTKKTAYFESKLTEHMEEHKIFRPKI